MYAFPTIMTTATSDPTVALAGTRVIGCVPVRLSDGSALRTSPLIAPGRIASPAATAQLPPNAGQTLEEVTLHCIAQAGVPLSRQQIADNLGATKNQMTYVLHHLVEQGLVLKRGRSRATRYSMP
jgi:ATP-dependent DNA helicase RecG